MICIAPKS